jgi:microcystin-dependent protein
MNFKKLSQLTKILDPDGSDILPINHFSATGAIEYQTIMRDASAAPADYADFLYQLSKLYTHDHSGLRNRLVNGNFILDTQNGAPYTIPNSPPSTGYTSILANWGCRANVSGSSGNILASRTTNYSLNGNPHQLFITRSVGSTVVGTAQILQLIPVRNSRDLAGNTVTVSLKAQKGSAYAGNLSVALMTGTGDESIGSALANQWPGQSSFSAFTVSNLQLSQTLTTHSGTVSIPSNCNQILLLITANFSSNHVSNDGLYISDIQLEKGSEVTPFDWRFYQIENLLSGLTEAQQQIYQTDTIPIGGIMYYPVQTPPVGFLEADGSEVSRSLYEELYGIIGTTFGNGNGVSTFNLPDLRGLFVRGWDDGRGFDGSRVFGSVQEDTLKSHAHELNEYVLSVNSINSSVSSVSGILDAIEAITFAGTDSSSGIPTITPRTNAVLPAGSFETRPKNIALLPCIKAARTVAGNVQLLNFISKPSNPSDGAVLAYDSNTQSWTTGTANTNQTVSGGVFLYDTPGVYSWVAPRGVYRIRVHIIGAGAGGSGFGGGGGGGYATYSIAVVPGAVYTNALNVGFGGAYRANGGNSTCSIGGLTITAEGGKTTGTNTGGDGGSVILVSGYVGLGIGGIGGTSNGNSGSGSAGGYGGGAGAYGTTSSPGGGGGSGLGGGGGGRINGLGGYAGAGYGGSGRDGNNTPGGSGYGGGGGGTVGSTGRNGAIIIEY